MAFFTLSYLVVSVILAMLAVFIIFRDSKSNFNRVIFFYLASIAFACFCQFGFNCATNVADGAFWLKASSIIPIIPALYIHFIYLHVKKHKDYSYHYAVYLPALFFIAVSFASNAITGTAFMKPNGTLGQSHHLTIINAAFYLWSLGIVAISCIWTIRFFRTPSDSKNETGIKRFLFVLAILSILTIVARMLSQLYFHSNSPFLELFFIVAIAVYQTYGVLSHKMTMPSLENASEEILRLMPEALFILSTRNEIVKVNHAALKLLSLKTDDVMYMNIEHFFKSSESGEVLSKKEVAGLPYIEEKEAMVRKPDGSVFPVIVSKTLIHDSRDNEIGSILVARDLTMRKKFESEIANVQKFKTVGTLAAGIAHDLNNYMTSIMLNISMAKLTKDEPDHFDNAIKTAEKATFLASDLAGQLLSYVKEREPIKKPINLPEFIKHSIDLGMKGSSLTYDLFVEPDLSPVCIDAGQMSQVFMNIILNARQAMPRGGKISIVCKNVVTSMDSGADNKNGSFVSISIQDFGQGISKENLPKIFEPFFTTKESGSGLGLAICKSIIQKHGGTIDVSSRENMGTTVTILLPVCEQPIEPSIVNNHEIKQGSGRILVMDDEQMVRDSCSEILDMYGYEVELAKDGGEAIQKYLYAMQNKTPFNFVILDLTVCNGLNAKDAIKRLKELDPSIKAIVSSGYREDPVISNYKDYGFVGVLPKPYSIKEFMQVFSITNPQKWN